jgi:hypothetical protein
MSNKNVNECPVSGGCDKVSCLLGKLGINRSLLITLSLLPFAWNGVAVAARLLTGIVNTLSALING